MHDEVNQKISGFIDGELSYDETMDLLKKIQSDDGLRTKMCRYQAISQALKTDKYYQVTSDFSRQVLQEIQQEPAYFLPQLKKETPPTTQIKQANRNKMLAIAASTIVAAVIIGQSLRQDPSAANYPTVTAMSSAPQQPPIPLINAQENLKKDNREPLNAQFNDYLQAHNSSVYTNGEANFQPYAKVTSFGQR